MTHTPPDIAALEALEAAATPGPWMTNPAPHDRYSVYIKCKPKFLAESSWHSSSDKFPTKYEAHRNFAFIVALRNAAPELFKAVKERDRMKQWADDLNLEVLHNASHSTNEPIVRPEPGGNVIEWAAQEIAALRKERARASAEDADKPTPSANGDVLLLRNAHARETKLKDAALTEATVLFLRDQLAIASLRALLAEAGKAFETINIRLSENQTRDELSTNVMWAADHARLYAASIQSALRDASPKAAADVLAERARQIAVEGWTPEHDNAHEHGEMALAAACYAASPREIRAEAFEPCGCREALCEHWQGLKSAGFRWAWPWDKRWWKPKDRRRDLVRAGALILAEIERMDRLASLQPEDVK